MGEVSTKMRNIHIIILGKSLEEIMRIRPQARWEDNTKISFKHAIRE
jgi:hypothetical protein